MDEATRYIYEHTDPDVNIILGTVIDESMNGVVQATIIATDFAGSIPLKTTTVKVPESKVQTPPKSTGLSLETPSFMTKPAPAMEFKSQGAFAIPAFKLAPDNMDEKK